MDFSPTLLTIIMCVYNEINKIKLAVGSVIAEIEKDLKMLK